MPAQELNTGMSKRPRDPEEQEAEAAAIRAREDRDDPVSLEDLLHAKKEEQMELSKPVSISTLCDTV